MAGAAVCDRECNVGGGHFWGPGGSGRNSEDWTGGSQENWKIRRWLKWRHVGGVGQREGRSKPDRCAE
eukprot:scaffold217945_cov48-Attheya_sp.AAC.1